MIYVLMCFHYEIQVTELRGAQNVKARGNIRAVGVGELEQGV